MTNLSNHSQTTRGTLWSLVFFLLILTSCFQSNTPKQEANDFAGNDDLVDPNVLKIRLAILDTGFCPNKLTIPKSVTIEQTFDATNSVSMNCTDIQRKNRRYHGHLVLKEFLANLKTDKEITIHPIIIFDNRGKQNLDYWYKALDHARSEMVNVILSSAGYPLKPHDLKKAQHFYKIKSLAFLASGRAGIDIDPGTQLFPQFDHNKKNIFLIGSVHPPFNINDYIYDNELLYKEHIDYFFPSGKGDELKGPSRAAPIALARAINLCPTNFPHDPIGLRDCLKKNEKIITTIRGKKLPSY